MVVQLQNSHLRCPRDKTRLAFNPVDAGQNDADGDYEEVHFCLECDYRETVRPERSKVVDPALLDEAREAIRRHHARRAVPAPAAFQAILEETQ